MKHFLAVFCLLFCLSAFAENYAYPFTATRDAERFSELTQEIRCVVCQNQTIADSNAPLAQDLRAKVYRMINDHQSNTAIKNYLVKRYGEFILFKPRVNQHTVLLWGFPFLALAFIVVFALFFIHSTKK